MEVCKKRFPFDFLIHFYFLYNLDWFWGDWHFSSGLDNLADLRRQITQMVVTVTPFKFSMQTHSGTTFVPWRQNIKTLLPPQRNIYFCSIQTREKQQWLYFAESTLSNRRPSQSSSWIVSLQLSLFSWGQKGGGDFIYISIASIIKNITINVTKCKWNLHPFVTCGPFLTPCTTWCGTLIKFWVMNA